MGFLAAALVLHLTQGHPEATPSRTADSLDSFYVHADALIRTGPRDVAAWANRIEACVHWAGEEPYDKGRRRGPEHARGPFRASSLRGAHQDEAPVGSGAFRLSGAGGPQRA